MQPAHPPEDETAPQNRQQPKPDPRPQHSAGERFLCSLRLNYCRSGPIRPTGGTPERQDAQKPASDTGHSAHQ